MKCGYDKTPQSGHGLVVGLLIFHKDLCVLFLAFDRLLFGTAIINSFFLLVYNHMKYMMTCQQSRDIKSF